MFPNLSYFFHYIFGTEPDNVFSVVQTFGMFLAISFLVGAYFLRKELSRKADEGLFQPEIVELSTDSKFNWLDNIINGAILGLLIMKLAQVAVNYDAFKKNPSAVVLTWDGPWYILLIVLVLYVAYYFNKWKKAETVEPSTKTVKIYPHDRIGDITVIAAISGVVGSKLFSVIEDLHGFFKDPIGSFFSGSGLNIYGGLILGFLGVFLYLRKHKISIIHVMDSIAPALIIAYGAGRVGCQLSGDGDWGIQNNSPVPGWWFLPDSWWAYDYPHNVIDEGVPITGCTWKHCMHLAHSVYPTPFYEILLSVLIFGILWSLRKRIKIAGVLFFVYMILNGFERFWIEKIRINDKYDILGMHLTQAEFIAILYMIIGTIGIIFLYNRSKKVLQQSS